MHNVQQENLNRGLELPRYYGEDRLVLLPRDPYCIFAYWEITPAVRDRLREKWGEEAWNRAFPQLRVIKQNPAEREEESFEITIQAEAENWYLTNAQPDCYYHLELGWRHPVAGFQPLLRSNTVRTPRDGISNIIDEEWQLPDWKARKLYRRISLFHLSSPEFFRRQKRKF